MIDLQDLLARVEAAAGPDRVLDFELHIGIVCDEIWPATNRQGFVTNPYSRMSDYLATYRDVINADDQDFDFPRYTASLDAALALCERVLPGCRYRLEKDAPATSKAFWATCGMPGEQEHAEAASAPLALLAAILNAKIAEAASPESRPSGELDAPKTLPDPIPTGWAWSAGGKEQP